MRKIIVISLLATLCTVASRGQSITWDYFAEQYFQETDDEDNTSTTLYDELLEMHRNPINLNEAKREDLLRIPFLSEAQADSVLSYVRRNGGMMSIGELMFIRNIEYAERRYMPLFFYCPDDGRRPYTPRPDSLSHHHTTPRRQLSTQHLRNEISATLTVPLYKREGFKNHDAATLSDNPNRQYLGNNLSHTLRYRASLDNRLLWGLTAQKDEGEPFASRGNTLYDSYSLYLMSKNSGAIKQWVVGDYRAHFGLGLTVGSSSADAIGLITSYSARTAGFTPHTSTDEYNYLRGGALSLKLGSVVIHAFASWRELDATLKHDSITTIITNGYHRTPLEMSKRHNIQSLQGGLSTTYSRNNMSLGINITHTHYDTPYITPTALYRRYYFHNQDFGNYSLSYSWRKQRCSLWGETATSLQGGIATQHRLQYYTSSRFRLMALHRYYSTHYLSTTAQSYHVGSRIQNEHGLMLGAHIQLNDLWTTKGYIDYAHYPFATYNTTHAADAITAMLQAECAYSLTTSFMLRYKYRQRPKDNSQDSLSHTAHHTFKAQASYCVGPVAMVSAADLALLSQPDKGHSASWMLSQRASLKIASASAKPALATRLNMAAAIFHTDSYAEALRLYEPALLYASSYPTCYYHGQRVAVSVVQSVGPLQLALKYSITHYTNRQTIGTDLRRYDGATLQDVAVQGMWRF